jgi:hypothetical protein
MSTARLFRTLTIGPLPGDAQAPADDTPRLEQYARSRGLAYTAEGLLPGVTPALRRGRGQGAHRSVIASDGGSFLEGFKLERPRKRPERRTSDICSGTLPGGAEGLVGYQTHLVRHDANDDGAASWLAHQHTVVFVDLGTLAGQVSEVDAGVRHEMKALLTIGRQKRSSNPVETMVFPPTTVEVRGETTWKFTPAEDAATVDAVAGRAAAPLAEAPAGVEIEIEHGFLCVWVRGALADEAQLDALCRVASAIVDGLADAARRHAPLSGAEPVAPPEPTDRRRWIEAGMATVQWAEPPTDFRTAVDAYRTVTKGRGRRIGTTIAFLLFVVALPILAGGVYVTHKLELGATGFTASATGAGLFFLWMAWKLLKGAITAGHEMSTDMRDERAVPWGFGAYIRGYAETRGMVREEQAEVRRRFVSPLRGRPTCALHGTLGDGVTGHLVYWYEPLADEGSRQWALAIVDAPDGTVPEPPAPYVSAVTPEGLLIVGLEVVPAERTAADLDGVAATAVALTRAGRGAVAAVA